MAPLEDSTNWGTQETSKQTSSHALARLACQNPLGLDPTSMKGQAPTSPPAGMLLPKPQNLRSKAGRAGEISTCRRGEGPAAARRLPGRSATHPLRMLSYQVACPNVYSWARPTPPELRKASRQSVARRAVEPFEARMTLALLK